MSPRQLDLLALCVVFGLATYAALCGWIFYEVTR